MFRVLLLMTTIMVLQGCKGGSDSDNDPQPETPTEQIGEPQAPQNPPPPTEPEPGNEPDTPPTYGYQRGDDYPVPEDDKGTPKDGYRHYENTQEQAELRLTREGGEGILGIKVNGEELYLQAGGAAISRHYQADTQVSLSMDFVPENATCSLSRSEATLPAGSVTEVLATCSRSDAPTRPVIQHGYTAHPTEIAVDWAPATDLKTPAEDLTYRVLYSTEPGEVEKGRGSEVAISAGQTSTTITGLTSGTRYTVAVVAVDTDGNHSQVSVPIVVSTANQPPVRNTNNFHLLDKASVSDEGARWRVPMAAFKVSPQVGEVLIREVENSYRWAKIVTVEPDGADYLLSLDAADLDDLYTEIQLSSATVVRDAAEAAPEASSASPTDPQVNKSASNEEPVVARSSATTKASKWGFCEPSWSTDQDLITIDKLSDFSPSLDVRREVINGEKWMLAQAAVTGLVGMKATVAVPKTGAYQIVCSFPLASSTVIAWIPAGLVAIPVPIENAASFKTQVEVGTGGQAQYEQQFFVRYTGEAFAKVNLDSFSPSFDSGLAFKPNGDYKFVTPSVSGEVKAGAGFEVKSTIAGVAFAALKLGLGGKIDMGGESYKPWTPKGKIVGFPIVLTKFDVDVGPQASIQVGIQNPFNPDWAMPTATINLLDDKVRVFELPKICLNGAACDKEATIAASSTNEYDLSVTVEALKSEHLPDAVDWMVSPAFATLDETTNGPEQSTVTLTTKDSGAYLVAASIPTPLGDIARQYAFINVAGEACMYGLTEASTEQDQKYWRDEFRGFDFPEGYKPGEGIDAETGDKIYSTGAQETCRFEIPGSYTTFAPFFNGELNGRVFTIDEDGNETGEYLYYQDAKLARSEGQNQYPGYIFGYHSHFESVVNEYRFNEGDGKLYLVSTSIPSISGTALVDLDGRKLTIKENYPHGKYGVTGTPTIHRAVETITGYDTKWAHMRIGNGFHESYQFPLREGSKTSIERIIATNVLWTKVVQDSSGNSTITECGYHPDHEGYDDSYSDQFSHDRPKTRFGKPANGGHYFCAPPRPND